MGTNIGDLEVKLRLNDGEYGPAVDRNADKTAAFGKSLVEDVGNASDTARKKLKDAGEQGGSALDHLNLSSVAVRRELLVLAHEASQGQWKNFVGSSLVMAERADALSLVFSGVGMAVGAVVGVLGLFSAALYQGHAETVKLNNDLKLTGNYAGVTADSVDSLARSLAAMPDGKLSQSREIMESLVASGRFTSDEMLLVGKNVQALEKLTGGSVDEIVKDFAKMPEGVAKWAEEHNRWMHFVSAAQYDYIRTLEDQGRKEEAQRVVSQALYDHLGKEAPKQLGYLETAWRGLKIAVSETWDAMKGLGRGGTDGDALEKQYRLMADLQSRRDRIAMFGRDTGPIDAEIAKGREELARLNAKITADSDAAAKKSREARINEAGVDADKRIRNIRLETDERAKLNHELELYRRDVAALQKADAIRKPGDKALAPDAKQQAADEAAIRKKYSTQATSELNKSLQAQIAMYDGYAKQREQIQAQEAKDLEAQRKLGLISEIDYINRSHDSQVQSLQDQQVLAEKAAQVAGAKGALAEREKYLARVRELAEKEATVNQDRVAQLRQAEKDFTDTLEQSRALMLSQAGITLPKVQLDMRKQDTGLLQNALDLNRPDDLAFIGQTERLKTMAAQLDDLLQKSKQAKEDIALSQREGTEGIVSGFEKMRDVSAMSTAGLRDLLGQIEQFRATTSDPEILAGLDQLKNKVRTSILDSNSYLADFRQIGSSAFSGFASDMSRSTETIGGAFRNMFANIASSASQLFANKAFTGLWDYLSAGSGSGGGAGLFGRIGAGISSLFGGVASAKGNVFSGGNAVKAFALGGAFTNTIATQPTMAPMALFGEAGPEAIMPLTRDGSGRLGVRAQGGAGGGNVTISIATTINGDGQVSSGTRTSGDDADAKSLGDTVNGMIRQVLAKETQPGGVIYKFVNRR